MTDAIENKRDIDVDRAEAAKARAERRLHATDRNYDLRRAEIALQKALNRLNVKGQ
jgi:F-type H+-transporting ATPase subunit epsilon